FYLRVTQRTPARHGVADRRCHGGHALRQSRSESSRAALAAFLLHRCAMRHAWIVALSIAVLPGLRPVAAGNEPCPFSCGEDAVLQVYGHSSDWRTPVNVGLDDEGAIHVLD